MLVLDTGALARHAAIGVVERTRHVSRRALADQIERDAVTVISDNKVDVTDANAQMGVKMHRTTLVDKVRRVCSKLFYETSNNYPEQGGFYTMGPDPINPMRSEPVKRFLIGCGSGWMPEFSIRHAETKRVPDPDNPAAWKTIQTFSHETRGWRTVVAALLRHGYLKVSDIEHEFPRLYRESQRWHEATR